MTGNQDFYDEFFTLAVKYGYFENALNQKIDNPYEDNHSDNELGLMAYHTLFYSLHRLQQALEEDKLLYLIKDKKELERRYDLVSQMTKPVIPSIKRWWSIVKRERSPLWLPIVAGAAQVSVPTHVKRQAVDSLRLCSC